MQLATTALPRTTEQARTRGWDQLDVIVVTPDAYVDHPAFAAAVIGRVLEGAGFRVGILDQPDWNCPDSFRVLGEPRLFFGISGGNVDSMLHLYTAAKKRRTKDPYSPGAEDGMRPERPTIVYASKLRQIFRNTPLVLGGIEASLRRFAHYDFWEDRVRKPLMVDTPARLTVYGPGERAVVAIARRLSAGESIEDLVDIPGTVIKTKHPPEEGNAVVLPDAELVARDKDAFARATKARLSNREALGQVRMVQRCQNWFVVENPPAPPLRSEELDAIYSLPFTRRPHRDHLKQGVPAIDTVRFSLVSHRGCFGDCSFCALSLHQGKVIQSRSPASLCLEATMLTKLPEWKGRIHDVGGPTANMYGLTCSKHGAAGTCSLRRCLAPKRCQHLETDQTAYRNLLERLAHIPGIKGVNVGSGCRHDLLLLDPKTMDHIIAHNVSGQLKIAPEHTVDEVTLAMGKPPGQLYDRFRTAFQRSTNRAGKEQYVVPYLMSSHPGCSFDAMVKLLVVMTEEWHYFPEQVQNFIPTPSSLATSEYWTGHNPLTGKSVFVARESKERAMQRAMLQPKNPKNRQLVLAGLERSHLGQKLIASGRARRLWPYLFSRGPKRDSSNKSRAKRSKGRRR